jgi:hypothetical protein
LIKKKEATLAVLIFSQEKKIKIASSKVSIEMCIQVILCTNFGRAYKIKTFKKAINKGISL